MNVEPLIWQPILGCSYISVGCTNCAALKAPGLIRESKAGPVWTGELWFDEAALQVPLHGVGPVLVCPHGDLFHDAASDDWIDLIFLTMLASSRTFFVLTKRAARMRNYVNARFADGVPAHIWLGISAERQREADERVGALLETRAAQRWVTFYPLLGPIALPEAMRGAVSLVLMGQEAQRPADPAWFEGIETDCAKLGVPCGRDDRVAG